jgi:hypothetical protein
MKKLNQLQKEMIVKMFPKLANLIIKYVEKIGNEKDTLENNIQLAYDMIQEKQ